MYEDSFITERREEADSKGMMGSIRCFYKNSTHFGEKMSLGLNDEFAGGCVHSNNSAVFQDLFNNISLTAQIYANVYDQTGELGVRVYYPTELPEEDISKIERECLECAGEMMEFLVDITHD